MVNEGVLRQIKRNKDQCYLYTLSDNKISSNSTNINHHLRIVDFFIQEGKPKDILIEPQLGGYIPDIFYKNQNGNTVCVEIQLTQISKKKMNEKINSFISEYGKTHNSKILTICSNYGNKNTIKNSFKIIYKSLPQETLL